MDMAVYILAFFMRQMCVVDFMPQPRYSCMLIEGKLVLRGDKRDPSTRGCNLATLSQGDLTMRTWPYRVEESQESDSKISSRGLRDLNQRVPTNWTSKLQARPLVRQGAHIMKTTNIQQQ
jgi:hypothetical protein